MTSKPVVVLGSQGMVGRAWLEMLQSEGESFVSVDRAEVDISDAISVKAFIGEGVSVVINCAAWANVDAAEAQESQATLVNGTAVGILAARCREVGATLIQYGTDYVFDGEGREPYPVDHPVAPLNAYGRGKALGEHLLRNSGADYLLIRTSWVYAPWGKNFVRTMARLSVDKSQLKVVNDQRGRPTSAEGLVRNCWALWQQGARGTFHVTDGGECTWYELASHVVSLAVPRNIEQGLSPVGHCCEVVPCTSDQYPTPARRPHSSVLCLAKTEALLGKPTPWRQAVQAIVKRLETDQS